MAAWLASTLAPIRSLLRETTPQTPPDHFRLLVISITVSIALLINHYLAINTSLSDGLRWFAATFNQPVRPLLSAVHQSPWRELLGYLWWGSWLLIGYVLIPLLVIRFVLRDNIREYGLHLGDTRKHWRYYAIFGAVMGVMAIGASFNNSFLDTYPFYSQAGRSWQDLLLWQLIYIGQFVCIEFFYRGFLLRGLQPSFGISSIYVSSLIYLTIHLPKPFLECVGSLFFGLILCLLASLSRSIWGGVFVHVCLAVSMDVLSLFQRGQLPLQ